MKLCTLYLHYVTNYVYVYVHEFVFFCVCICVGRGGPPAEETEPRGGSIFVASHPLALHLTNYCATSMPLMKPGTCPSVLL